MSRHNNKFSKPSNTKRKNNNQTEVNKIKRVMKAQKVDSIEAKKIMEADKARKVVPNSNPKRLQKNLEFRAQKVIWNSIVTGVLQPKRDKETGFLS